MLLFSPSFAKIKYGRFHSMTINEFGHISGSISHIFKMLESIYMSKK